MNRYLSIFKIRLKIQFRICGYYTLIPSTLFLLAMSTIGRAESQLSATGYVTQALMLVGALMGYHGGLRDEKEAGESMYIHRHSYAGQMLSVLAEWCFLALVNLILFVYIVIFGIATHSEAWYFKDASLYLLIYYFFPTLLTELIGRVFALMEKSVVHYALMTALVLLLGPMGRGFLESVLGAVLGDRTGKLLVDFVNIGQLDIGYHMDMYYGMQVETKRLWHVLLFVAVLFFLWSTCMLFFVKSRNAFRVILPLFAFALCALFTWQYRIPCYLATSESSDNTNAISYYDRLYYQDYKVEEKEALFRIDRIAGTVDTRRLLRFVGTVEGEILSDTNALSFRLYHDFKVKELTGDGVETYEQDGDVVRIFYRQEQQAGTPVNLALCYEGTSSPYFYVNERAVFLPSYFNWLPCPGEGSAMRTIQSAEEMEKLAPVPTFLENEVFYDLAYLGGNETYSNLAKTEDGHFSGTSQTGVYLLSNNHMRTYSFSNGEIISCVKLTDEFAAKAGSYVSGDMAKLQEAQGQQTSGEYRILLIPHHIVSNTVSLEYAVENTIYCDADSWYTLQGWSSEEDVEEALFNEVSCAFSQFGK